MMRIKVLKFGGTSLKDDLSRLKVISILNEESDNWQKLLLEIQ